MVFCNTLAAFTFIALAAMTSPAAAQAPVVRNCGGPNDIIKVADITLTPAHPGPGEQVTLVTNTHVASQVSGGRAQVTVTVHGQQVFHDDRDFCDVVAESGLSCPVTAGDHHLTGHFTVPALPSPTDVVTVRNSATGLDNAPLFCFEFDIDPTL